MGRTQRLLRFLVAVVATLAIALPLAAGPMLGALVGAKEHTCLCGMKAGECGCPDCVELEKQDRAQQRQRPPAIVRTSCNDDVAVGPSIPPALEANLTHVLEAPRGERVAVPAPCFPDTQTSPSPPTPPPRA